MTDFADFDLPARVTPAQADAATRYVVSRDYADLLPMLGLDAPARPAPSRTAGRAQPHPRARQKTGGQP